MERKRYEILWEQFVSIINDKARSDSYFDGLDSEIRRIRNLVEKESDDIKKAFILDNVISFVQNKISRGIYSGEIINSMYASAADEKKILKDKEYYFVKGTSIKIEDLYNALEGATREQLIGLEDEYNTLLKDKTEVLGQKLARGEIIGSLNRGMYGSTRDELVKTITDNGVAVKNNDRFISYMNNDLLKFRIIALRLAGVYCDKAHMKLLEETNDTGALMDKKSYNKLRKKVEKLGDYIKIMYENNFNLFPRDEIFINTFGIDSDFMKNYFSESNSKHK